MAIISGVNIPDNKKVEVSLRSIFGIGPTQALDIINKAGIEGPLNDDHTIRYCICRE